MELWSHQVSVESHALTPTSLARIQVVITGFDTPGMEEETLRTDPSQRTFTAHLHKRFATAAEGAFSCKHADAIGGVLSLPRVSEPWKRGEKSETVANRRSLFLVSLLFYSFVHWPC